jgi:hypothetical protein
MMKTKTNGKTNGFTDPGMDEKIDTLVALCKIANEEMPRQRYIADWYASNHPPSLDFILDERRRQFQMLALQYAMLPDDWKHEFIDRLRPWWKKVKENEARADEEIAEHRRRGTVA